MDGVFSVSILGAGPAGFALAADLERHGTRTLVYSHPSHLQHALSVQQIGHLKVEGVVEGIINLRITTNIAEAVAFSRIIVLAVPSSGQETLLQLLRPHSLRRHTLVAVPGNLFSIVKDSGIETGNVLETNLSPYACRMEGGVLQLYGKKRCVFISALRNDAVRAAEMQAVFPGVRLRWCSSVVEVCLSNINGVFHPLMVLMNAGRIEDTAGDFLLYRDGLTRSVANAMEALDRARIRIGTALGLRLRSAAEVSNECYGQHFADLVDLARNSPPHNRLRAPAGILSRNVSEDVQDLLVAWHGLAEKLGVDASPISAVIVLVEMATGASYAETGRNLAKLKLDGVSKEELVARFGPAIPQRHERQQLRIRL
ncbi:NAD/NADP octopine/nopaline dehydrogenase [Gaeumannomyces tritici R3-111a-1]|uniref:NAD/NADP octopine/nopaline dehydrogenase n=1 Tax=Gaeumannomyces tritici (strain R3-111a-1) TaxID=644352 RepID=J3P1T5_GAET3|nr:NAD/NADP octopine/nopaline dehydrogenase [Gaeumannomyces tritici R3-111a-1]EJT73627.1 NAD/NADP octopine/nopaline dehydrogenase [Gaeumannomyces tritici R3-111a-1]